MTPLSFAEPVAAPESMRSAAIARAVNSVALVDASPGGAIVFATPRAEALLQKYFSTDAIWRLPEELLQWLAIGTSSQPTGALPFITHRDGSQLVVRLSGKRDKHFQLLIEEKNDHLWLIRMRSLGLTRREAEVLLWIARGKTRPEIAAILACSSGTVAKHTEHILAKLGVETRTAAAVLALDVAI